MANTLIPCLIGFAGMYWKYVIATLMYFIILSPIVTCVEEHRGLGGNIISRLDNGAIVGLIYSLLVFS